MSNLLTRAQIVGAHDLKTEDVDVPEWGGTVRIAGMTGAERDTFEESLFTGEGVNRKQNLTNLRARLVAITLVDDAGVRLFSSADIATLSAKSAAALTRCFEAAQRLNGMGAKEAEEMGNVLPVAPSDGSTSV